MKKYAIIFVLILTLGISAFGQKIQILEIGAFHGEEVSAESGDNWFGLFKFGNDHALFPVVLWVETVRDEIVDAPDEKTGKEVKTVGHGKPLFLIKGKNLVQRRKIETVFAGEKSIGGDFNENYEFAGVKYNVKVESERKDKENPQYLNESSKLTLSDGRVSQTIFSVEACDDCAWQMIWAGDLDADGKLDFYLQLNSHYNSRVMRLFLSSEAENGNLVKEVAEFGIVGC